MTFSQILSPIVIPCAKLRFRKLQKKVRAAEDSGVVVGTQNYGHKLSQSLYQHQQDGYAVRSMLLSYYKHLTDIYNRVNMLSPDKDSSLIVPDDNEAFQRPTYIHIH